MTSRTVPRLAQTLSARSFRTTPVAQKVNLARLMKPNAKLTESELATMSLADLKKLIAVYKQPIPANAKRENVYRIARRLVKDKLIQNSAENAAVELSLLRRPNTNTTLRNENDMSRGEEYAEHNVLPTEKEILEITKTITPANAPKLGITPQPDNALGLFDQVSKNLHEVLVLRPILKSFSLTPQNRQRIATFTDIRDQEFLLQYEKEIRQTLQVILSTASRSDVKRILQAFTPERLVRFKANLLYAFQEDPSTAKKILDAVLIDIVTRSDLNAGVIEEITTSLATDYSKTLDLIQKRSGKLTNIEEDLKRETAAQILRGKSMFKSRTMSALIVGGLGGLAMLIVYYYSGSPQGLAWELRTRIVPTILESEVLHELALLPQAAQQKLSESAIGPTLQSIGETVKSEYASFTEPVRNKPWWQKLSSAFSTNPPNSEELR